MAFPNEFCNADCGCAGGQKGLTCTFEPDCSICRPRQALGPNFQHAYECWAGRGGTCHKACGCRCHTGIEPEFSLDVAWAEEHVLTKGAHYGLKGPDTSAATHCPICKAFALADAIAVRMGQPGWEDQARTAIAKGPAFRDSVARPHDVLCTTPRSSCFRSCICWCHV